MQIVDLNKVSNHHIIYTDGAASGNPGPAGAAWSIDGVMHGKAYDHPMTNNEVELLAIYSAVAALPVNSTATVYTDSKTCVSWLTQKIPCPYSWRNNLWELSKLRKLNITFILIEGKSTPEAVGVDQVAKAKARLAKKQLNEKRAGEAARQLDEDFIQLMVAKMMGKK